MVCHGCYHGHATQYLNSVETWQQGWEDVPQLQHTQKRVRRVPAHARSVRPQSMVDETERVSDKLSVTSCQFRLYNDDGGEPSLKVVQGDSVCGICHPQTILVAEVVEPLAVSLVVLFGPLRQGSGCISQRHQEPPVSRGGPRTPARWRRAAPVPPFTPHHSYLVLACISHG